MQIKSIDPFFAGYAVIVVAFALLCLTNRPAVRSQTPVQEASATSHNDPDQIRLAG
ncbi:MAG: hypothetical protein QM647_09335 [Asticcacaulis sp.]|uniref:hypothetical protein n=1 Tax=Asticcacaulis sp. TaxID=1872648 RepID=UPI0039E2F326